MAQNLNVGTLNANLSINDKDFKKRLNGVASKMKSVGKTMSMALTAPLVALGGMGIKYASDLQEVQNVVDTAFKDSAKEVDRWAKTTLKQFGLTELQAKKYSSVVRSALDGTVPAKEADKMSLAISGLTGDFASFYNLDHETAFTKLQTVISGEVEPLRQLGINMSVANLEAYAMGEGITKAYKDMSEAERVTLRYNFVMSKTKMAQGDFLKTNDSFANSMRVLKGQFMSFIGDVMKQLLPYLGQGVMFLRKWIEKFSQMTPAGKKLTLVIGGILALAGPLLIFLGTLISSITALNVVLSPITLIVGAIVLAIVGLALAFRYLWKNNEEFKTKVIALWNEIKDSFEIIMKALKEFWEKYGEDITNYLAQLWKQVENIIMTALNLITGLIRFWKAVFTGDWEGMLEAVKDIFGSLFEFILKTIDNILGIFGTSIKDIVEVGKNIVIGLWEGIKSKWDWLKDKVKDVAGSIGDSFKNVLGIHSPSKVFEGFGKNITEGLDKGLKTSASLITDTSNMFKFDISAKGQSIYLSDDKVGEIVTNWQQENASLRGFN